MPIARKTAVRRTRRAKDLASDVPAPVAESEPLSTAAERLRKENAKSLPVVAGDHVVGTIKGPNVESRTTQYGHDPSRVPVSASMSREPISIHEDQSIDEARALMNHHQIDHLPVVDSEGVFLGILDRATLPQSDTLPPADPTRAEVCPGTRTRKRPVK